MKPRANVVFPKEFLNGDNLSNYILEGSIFVNLGEQRITINNTKISCKKKKVELKKKALWFGDDRKLGLKGIVIETGLRNPNAAYIHANPKTHEEDMQQSLDHLENIIPGIVIPRNTKVTIIFSN